MKPETQIEKESRERRDKELASHRWRVQNWQTVQKFWMPDGLTCPNCRADHCEIDGHSC